MHYLYLLVICLGRTQETHPIVLLLGRDNGCLLLVHNLLLSLSCRMEYPVILDNYIPGVYSAGCITNCRACHSPRKTSDPSCPGGDFCREQSNKWLNTIQNDILRMTGRREQTCPSYDKFLKTFRFPVIPFLVIISPRCFTQAMTD